MENNTDTKNSEEMTQCNSETEGCDKQVADDGQPAVEAETAGNLQPTETSNEDAADPKAELLNLLAEAEERGYKRGVNEQLRKALDQPDLFADLARKRVEHPTQEKEDQLSSKFLTTIRPGIWD